MEGKNMSGHVLTCNGFQGSIEVSLEDNCLFGRLLHIDDLVTYEGETPEQLRVAFEQAIHDYLALCQEEGKEPNKPFKGSLNIRIGTELHECAAKRAALLGLSLNDLIRDAVEASLAESPARTVQEIHHHDHKHYLVSVASSTEEFDYSNDNGFVQWQEQKTRAPAH